MKIEYLEIFTERLEEQSIFYQQVLNLPVREVTEEGFEVVIGYSVLRFQKSRESVPYHIAFHIPPRQEEQALEWLKQRVSIIRDGQVEIIDFPAWNAKSLYFYDLDGNILELISRKHFFPETGKVFSSESLIGISEIGVATDEVAPCYEFLKRHFGLEKFTGDFERFCATGDDEGLFIVIDKNRKSWFPANDKAFPADFSIKFSTKYRNGHLEYKKERFHIL